MQENFRVATDRTLAFETVYEDNLDGLVDGLEVELLLMFINGVVDQSRIMLVFTEYVDRIGNAVKDSLFAVAQHYIDELNDKTRPTYLDPVSIEYVSSFKTSDGYSVDEWLDMIFERSLGALLLSMIGGNDSNSIDALASKLKSDLNLLFTSVTSEMMRDHAERLSVRFEKSKKGYIYWHLNSGSGICPECAPYLGVYTTGSDGAVPKPPLHQRCRCFWAPVDLASEKPSVNRHEHYEWLSRLSRGKLEKVIGKKRARLVFDSHVNVRDLYDDEFNLV